MPAGNSRDDLDEYSSVLDEVYELTQKYATSSNMIWLGDLNGDINRSKLVERDKLLTSFCAETGYMGLGDLSIPTFHHHGISTSRLDYIMQLKNQAALVMKVEVISRELTNLSPHDPVIGVFDVRNDTPKCTRRSSLEPLPLKARWDRLDKQDYREKTSNKLACVANCLDATSSSPVESLISDLQTALYDAAMESSSNPSGKRMPRRRKCPWNPAFNP